MRRIAVLCAVLAMALVVAGCGSGGTAGLTPSRPDVRPAITYGQLDGNQHPNVGAMVAEWRTPGVKDLLCSGTLIAPTVFLTASHCTAYLQSINITQVWVTFDSHFDATTSTLYPGTMHTNPGFNRRQSDPGDVAVITFAQTVSGITPAQLPTAGLFTQMAAQNGLRGKQFTAVGYGVLERQVGGGPPTFPDTVDRHRAVSTFNALTRAWLRLSQNPATGNGGTCYGDSGGPNFLGAGANETAVIAAITITGDVPCRATNVTYRLDTQTARTFLANFVTLP